VNPDLDNQTNNDDPVSKPLTSKQIVDFISSKTVRLTPEERDAVQPFARALVQDYGYPKSHIQTHPQWRVSASPSDTKKTYPVDIVVFANEQHEDGNESIFVECKKKNRKVGRKQLEHYLTFCGAQVGVWYNGEERLYLKKTEKQGKVYFSEIPNIPRYGQRLEDVGQFKRKDLVPAHNLKTAFKAIRNYWAANAVGITRDERFAQQLINVIFCKIYDERFTRPDDYVSFRAGIDEKPEDVRARVLAIFANVQQQYSDVIEVGDTIVLDAVSVTYLVGEIQQFCLIDSERDVIADAFEIFISHALKGPQGQFFTPRNVVRLVMRMVSPEPGEKLIDPACGSGGFLIESLRHLWRRVDEMGKELNWPDHEVYAEKQRVAIQGIRGIEKDSFLAKVAKAYMAILGDGRAGVFCDNSLVKPSDWNRKTRDSIQLDSFDVVVTNPPFGKKLKIDEKAVLRLYKLGYRWKKKKRGGYTKLTKLQDSQPPQILFVERCLQMLAPGGRMGVIVPESMFSNPGHRYIVQQICSIARILAVVSTPEELFQPYTHAKTCVVLIEKKSPNTPTGDHEIFMAHAKWCGHDSRGAEIPHDDLPQIYRRWEEYEKQGHLEYDHLGFIVRESQIVNNVYLPKYYNPEVPERLNTLTGTHRLVSLGELVKEGVLSVTSGNEVGKLNYGTGNVPFVRTSDIANWEIKGDPKQGLSEDVYQKYMAKQDVRENDILMVRDGTYLVGTCALITRLDTRIVYQSHIYKIRSNDHRKLHPYLLLAILSSPILAEQIYAKRFTQDIIDTLGERLHELVLPIPRDVKRRDAIIAKVREIVEARIHARELTREALLSVAPELQVETDSSEYEFFSRQK
jgi:type I restriction enzyme M protein